MDHHETATWEDLAIVRDRGTLSQDNPDVVAIFQQLKNLRDSERSIRSLRRSLSLDNMPVLDAADVEDDEPLAPEAELDRLLDRFLQVKRDKENIERRFRDLVSGYAQLQETVRNQAKEIEALRSPRAS